MAYPEKVLADDEQLVEHLHPHWITLVPATLWFLLVCAVMGVIIAFLPTGSAHFPLLIAVIVVAVLAVCWLSVRPWIAWRTTHYVFTTHRVLIRRGVLHREGRDIALARISDVSFNQTLWDRIVHAGSIMIESAGEHGQETLTNVPRSDKTQQTLNRLIEEDNDRRARLAYGQPMAQGQPGYPPPGYPPAGYPPPSG
ncbi:MAG: PH domain-containing protein [Actinomycetia bacterium]|nr:PH domain-containing protein [Actinomycetes bacterium]